MFQSSFELTGYITSDTECPEVDTIVSKLFRAYRLYNDKIGDENKLSNIVSKLFRAYRLYNVAIDVRCEKANVFQSSFELTGYITADDLIRQGMTFEVSKLFRAYRLYNEVASTIALSILSFQSSFELTGYITYALWKVHEY